MNDSFYYGQRQVIHYDRTGQPSYTYLPLTEADFLHPQPDDAFVHNERHAEDVRTIRRILRQRYRANPLLLVLSGVKLVWALPGLAQPAPDVVVIPNVSEPERARPLFDVVAEGANPSFVLEVVSPRLANADLVAKVAIYEQAGVPEYFILDAGLRAETEHQTTANYRWLGYRLVQGRYTPIEPDARGWLFSKTTKIWFGVTPQQDGFFMVDDRTGQPIVPDPDMDEAPAAAYAAAAARAHSIAAQLDLGNEWKLDGR